MGVDGPGACRALAGLTMSLVLGIPAARGDAARPPAAAGPLALGDSKAQLVYTPVPPCRIVDTRQAAARSRRACRASSA